MAENHNGGIFKAPPIMQKTSHRNKLHGAAQIFVVIMTFLKQGDLENYIKSKEIILRLRQWLKAIVKDINCYQ